jgi:hypothetical protein
VNTDGFGVLVNFTVAASGVATGTAEYQGVRYSFRGTFDANGQLVCPLQRGLRPPLGLRARFGEGWDGCDVSVRDPEGTWADGTCRWLPYDGKASVAPQAGKYTILSTAGGAVARPFMLTCSVKTNGTAQFLGRMADNTPVGFSGSVALGDGSVRGLTSISAPLYKNAGIFYGSFELGLGPQHPGGESIQWWLKPWKATDSYLPALPFQTCLSSAVPFQSPAAGSRITQPFNVSLGDGSVRFANGGSIIDGTSNTILIGERQNVSFPGATSQCSMKVNAQNGSFTGRIAPSSGPATDFYGVFLQGNYGYGIGVYLRDGKVGSVLIEAD